MAIPNEQLEAARMRKRWSVAVASEKVGVSINTFNRWERGLQVPQLSTLDLLCKAFDMSPEDLGFEHAVIAKRRIQPQHQEVVKVESTTQPKEKVVAPNTLAQDVMMPTQDGMLKAYVETIKRNLEDRETLSSSKDGSEEDMVGKEFSRRRVITTLLGTPISIFGLGQGKYTKLLHPAEILSLCEVSIPFSWKLYFEGGIDQVKQTLPDYLTQLTKLARESSNYQKRAASLASQGYQLASLLSSQFQNFGTAISYANQALTYANMVEDSCLQTAAFIRLALVYFYLKRPHQRLRAYERAFHYSQKASVLLQGRVYVGLSETHSNLGHEQEAAQHLELAHKTFPSHCEEDISFPYTYFNLSSLSGLEGIMHLNLNHPQQAWENFEKMDKMLPKELVPNRLELMVRQAMAAYKLGDRDQSCEYLETAVRSALITGNRLRYDEAYDIYEHLQQKWGKESRVKQAGELFLSI